METLTLLRLEWNIYNGFMFEVLNISWNAFEGSLFAFRISNKVYIDILFIPICIVLPWGRFY